MKASYIPSDNCVCILNISNIYSMVGRALCKLSDLRLRVFLIAYQPEAQPRADMQSETTETDVEGLITCIEPCLPFYKQYIV